MDRADEFIKRVEETMSVVKTPVGNDGLLVGVDLGTASVVTVVLCRDKTPVACKARLANVVKDGLVVDFAGAARITRELKEELEAELGVPLGKAAIAVPPGTGIRDCGTHRHVAESAGFAVTNILDEPTASNAVLGVKDGAVVDIGGGTTGLSIFKDGKAVYTADEPTGGVHATLVLAGAYKIPFDEAERMKKDPSKHSEVFPLIIPVFEKMAAIIREHIRGFQVDDIILVGGTCCMEGVERVIERSVGIRTRKPYNPMLVTPAGIALSCADTVMEW